MESRQQTSKSPVVTPKTNHVGTVLLYDIPIVSLYIEGQERLCLAQISNTLLKQFSYNEIHNRRVALGITCVQCTPVQLEILRRTGAMPVSSRRCGMITRREAERLCKSFLGDNAPPRLPEDFAFNVHHKCAWGCRGAFLPSRYNSSRAKCIKCTFCGLFFSPNKFIFHSHRIGANDKYIQPDAANFNSWRRHMMLSGQPHEEIVYAWEDVKAMFNGGTRKRLMSSSVTLSSVSAATKGKSMDVDIKSSDVGNCRTAEQSARLSPKRSKDTGLGAVSAVVGVTAVAAAVTQQLPIRPFNMRPVPVVPAAGSSNLPASEIMPFSRSFMMDYMWHAHTVQSAAHIYQQQQQQQQQQHKCSNSNGVSPTFSFPANCGLQPWLKAAGAKGTSFLVGSAATAAQLSPIRAAHALESADYNNFQSSNESATSAIVTKSNLADVKIFREPAAALPQLLTSSAFKPVMRKQQQQTHQKKVLNLVTCAVSSTVSAAATLVSASMQQPLVAATALSVTPAPLSLLSSSSSSSSSSFSSPLPSSLSQATSLVVSPTLIGGGNKLCASPKAFLRVLPPSIPPTSTLSANALEAAAARGKPYPGTPTEPFDLAPSTTVIFPESNYIKESYSSEGELDSEDDEMVDIETTEDDVQQLSPATDKQNAQALYSKIGAKIGCELGNSTQEIDVDGDDDDATSDDLSAQSQVKENAASLIYVGEQAGAAVTPLNSSSSVLNECLSASSQRGGDSLASNSSSIETVDNFSTKEGLPYDGSVKNEKQSVHPADGLVETTSLGGSQSPSSLKVFKTLNELSSGKQLAIAYQQGAVVVRPTVLVLEDLPAIITTVTTSTTAATTISTKSYPTSFCQERADLGKTNNNDNISINSNNVNNISSNNNDNCNNVINTMGNKSLHPWKVSNLSLQTNDPNEDLCNISQQLRQQQYQSLHLHQLYCQRMQLTHVPRQQLTPPVNSHYCHQQFAGRGGEIQLTNNLRAHPVRYPAHDASSQADGVG